MYAAVQGMRDILQNTDMHELYTTMYNRTTHNISQRYIQDILDLPYLSDEIIDMNIGINNGPLAGRTVDHLHIHMMPRFAGDVDDAI